jgi:ABC-2 type transport system permease protein
MKALITYLRIQLKIDLRDKGTLLNYYLVPLAFFLVMGAVFSSITPAMKDSLSATMSIFAITMGAVMGAPISLVRMRESNTLRAFKANGIPAAAVLAVHALSAFIHLFIVSAVIYFLTPLLFKAAFPAAPGFFFLCAALYLLACIGLGMLIGVIAPSQAYTTMFSMVLFMPTILFSGIMFPASMLPGALGWLGKVLPATYSLQSFYGLAYRTPADIQPGLAVSIVAAFAVLSFALAVWRLNSLKKTEQN